MTASTSTEPRVYAWLLKRENPTLKCLIYQEKIRKSRIVKLCKQAEELGFEMIKKTA